MKVGEVFLVQVYLSFTIYCFFESFNLKRQTPDSLNRFIAINIYQELIMQYCICEFDLQIERKG